MENNDELKQQLLAVLGASRFKHFVEYAWSSVSNDPFVSGYMVDALCEHLQAVHDGQIRRLVLALPIRHGKSLLTSVMFPVWLWLQNPKLRIISAACGEELAGRDSVRSRHLINSPNFQKVYGGCFSMVDDQNTKLNYQNTAGGFRKAVGTNTQTTGLDADVILVDDLIDLKKAKSEAERHNAIDFYTGTLESRLVRGTGKDRIVVAGHRVHDDDLFNHIWQTYGNDSQWTYLVLPAEAKPSVTNSYNNAIGWKDTREEGELLAPERFPRETIEAEKQRLRYTYHTLYQQDTTPRDGDRFRAEWFKTYTEDESHYHHDGKKLPKEKAWRIATCDTAISTSATADYTVCQVWDVIGNTLVLVDQLRKRLDGTKIVPALAAFFRQHQPQYLAVESEFVGRFVLDQLRADGITVRAFKAKGHGDKETRAVAAEIRLEAGRVWLPSRPWVADLESELLSFPNGRHDDQCFVAGTQIETATGSKVIEAVRIGELVLTRKGYRRVVASGCTGIKPTITIHTEDGRSLTGTPDHPVFCDDSWQPLQSLVNRSIYVAWNQQLSNTVALSTADTQTPSNEVIESITSTTEAIGVVSNTCTVESGRTQTDPYQMGTTFTTSTATPSTTSCQTLNVSRPKFTWQLTPNKVTCQTTPNTLTACDTLQQHGTAVKRGEHGTENMAKRHGGNELQQSTPVKSAAGHSHQSGRGTSGSVLTTADRRHVQSTNKGLGTSTPSVVGAASQCERVNTDRAKCVRRNVCGMSESGMQPVYNLTVEGEPEYFANGILVHNCDAMAMACILADRYMGQVEEELTPEQKQAQQVKIATKRFTDILNAGLPF